MWLWVNIFKVKWRHQKLTTSPAQAGGGRGWCNTLPWGFVKWPPKRSADALKFCIAIGASFAQLLAKKWPGQIRSRSHESGHGLRKSVSDRFFSEIMFSATKLLAHWLKWRRYGDLSRRWPMTISDISSLCLDLPKVIRRHWPWPTPYLPIVAKLVVSWGFLRLWGRVCGSFFFSQTCFWCLFTV